MRVGFRTMTLRPRWDRLLSEISKWDDRFERELAPWMELAVGLSSGRVGRHLMRCCTTTTSSTRASNARQCAILGWLEAHEGQAAYASIQNISGLRQGLACRPAGG